MQNDAAKGMEHLEVVDFGGQYAHLIANRVRNLGTFCKVCALEDFDGKAEGLRGVILSGGPRSVGEGDVEAMKGRLAGLEVPVLGICFGHQLLAAVYGGKLGKGEKRQYGDTLLEVAEGARLFEGTPRRQHVWMSHGDHVAELPPGFRAVARAADCAVAAYEDAEKELFGVQFHPEVVHTRCGLSVLRNFIGRCRVGTPWEKEGIRERVVARTREEAGDATLFLLVSGGVDSLVTLQVCIEAVGADRVRSLHVDTGLMRKGESDDILRFLAETGFRNIEVERAEAVFLQALKGVADPEQKRAIIGRLFVEVLRARLRGMGLGDGWRLVQGTIYPDTIESGGTKQSAKIKTHHNRVPEIQRMIDQGLVVEPLKELYKDEVRALGRELGLPDALLERHPFPGPGLGIRFLCHDPEGAEREGTAYGAAGLDLPELGEASAALLAGQPAEAARVANLRGRILPVRSVGVQGDERTYRHPLAVWRKGGTGEWPLWEVAKALGNRWVNEDARINRVVATADDLDAEGLEIRPTSVSKEGLDRLREVDAVLSAALRDEPDVWQAPVIALPMFGADGRQAYVLRAVCSRDAMTADAFALGWERLAELSAAVRRIDGAGVLFYDLTTKPPATIEWE